MNMFSKADQNCAAINWSYETVPVERTAFFYAAIFLSPLLTVDASAQADGSANIETAKPADTTSPAGVSYTSGSFTYAIPLLSIGSGEFPDRIDLSLRYDSSGNRPPNSAWTLSGSGRMTHMPISISPGFEGEAQPWFDTSQLSVVVGGRSSNFSKFDRNPSAGSWEAASLDGSSLSYTPLPGSPRYFEGNTTVGDFLYTASDGTTATGRISLRWSDENPVSTGFTATMPNGQGVELGSSRFDGTPTRIETSNGLVIVVHGSSLNQQVCAYNLAFTQYSQTTNCAASTQVATITFSDLPSNGGVSTVTRRQVTSVTLPDGGTYNFDYVYIEDINGRIRYRDQTLLPRGRNHLACVKLPGENHCSVANTYDSCDGPGVGSNGFEDLGWSGSRDRVISQTLADGRTVSYDYDVGITPINGRPCRGFQNVRVSEQAYSSDVILGGGSNAGGQQFPNVISITDRLGRTTLQSWTGENLSASRVSRNNQVDVIEYPEGNKVDYVYDSRGNITEIRRIAEPRSGLADIVTSATYPATCVNALTCNKATTTTDARGNTTTFTYSSDHGGVLSAVGPAVGGVSPATLYSYAQRSPWLLDGGSYSAGTPVWLLTEERSCISSALDLVNGTCAAGASDLVITSYDYGPDAGPNNLWLLGVVMTNGGETLRSCYSYDQMGRRIAATQPNANLASC